MIIVLSDSHARSFAFIQNVLPVFIGAAGFNNFNNDKNSASYFAKVDSMLHAVEKEDLVVVNFGSGLRHHNLKNMDLKPLVDATVSRFSSLCEHIIQKTGCDLFIIPPIPPVLNGEPTDKQLVEARLVKEVTRHLSEDSATRVVSLPEAFLVSVDGASYLRNEFSFDFIHIDQFVAASIVRSVTGKAAVRRDADSKLRYVAEYISSAGPIKVHGDLDESDLEMKAGSELDINRLAEKTRYFDGAVKKLSVYLGSTSTALVVNPGEGWPIEKLRKHLGIDTVEHSFSHSNALTQELGFLSKLFGFKSSFISVDKDLETDDEYDLVILQEAEFMNRKDKALLIGRLLKLGRTLVIDSINRDADLKLIARVDSTVLPQIAHQLGERSLLLIDRDASPGVGAIRTARLEISIKHFIGKILRRLI